MRLSKMLLACAAVSMIGSPVVASAATANPAAGLSLSKSVPAAARTSSKAGKSNAATGSFLIPAVAVLAIGAGILAAVSGDSKADSN